MWTLLNYQVFQSVIEQKLEELGYPVFHQHDVIAALWQLMRADYVLDAPFSQSQHDQEILCYQMIAKLTHLFSQSEFEKLEDNRRDFESFFDQSIQKLLPRSAEGFFQKHLYQGLQDVITHSRYELFLLNAPEQRSHCDVMHEVIRYYLENLIERYLVVCDSIRSRVAFDSYDVMESIQDRFQILKAQLQQQVNRPVFQLIEYLAQLNPVELHLLPLDDQIVPITKTFFSNGLNSVEQDLEKLWMNQINDIYWHTSLKIYQKIGEELNEYVRDFIDTTVDRNISFYSLAQKGLLEKIKSFYDRGVTEMMISSTVGHDHPPHLVNHIVLEVLLRNDLLQKKDQLLEEIHSLEQEYVELIDFQHSEEWCDAKRQIDIIEHADPSIFSIEKQTRFYHSAIVLMEKMKQALIRTRQLYALVVRNQFRKILDAWTNSEPSYDLSTEYHWMKKQTDVIMTPRLLESYFGQLEEKIKKTLIENKLSAFTPLQQSEIFESLKAENFSTIKKVLNLDHQMDPNGWLTNLHQIITENREKNCDPGEFHLFKNLTGNFRYLPIFDDLRLERCAFYKNDQFDIDDLFAAFLIPISTTHQKRKSEAELIFSQQNASDYKKTCHRP